MQMAEKKMQVLLPNDIIIEILSWLPAKPLLRLRWVCKYWFDLITNRDHDDDSFIKMHLHRSTTSSSSVLSFCFTNLGDPCKKQLSQGCYYNYKDTTHVVPGEVNGISHPFLALEHFHGILGSCNGLVLLLTKYLCIWNPCTKEYRVLPHPLTIDGVLNSFLITKDIYGFGYDQTIDDYKVIRIPYHYLNGDCHFRSQVQVYTLGTNSWRRIIGSSIPYGLENCSAVFLNGALYWMDNLHKNIISFDIGKEKFQHVSRTPNLLRTDDLYRRQVLLTDNPHYLHKLQVFEGSLCLVLKINCHQNSPVEIWVMKDYTVNNNHTNNNDNGLWVKLLTIPHMRYFPIKPLTYTMNGEILMLNNNKDLVLYDTKNIRYQTLSRIREDRSHFLSLEVYTESLVSVNSGTYTDQQEHNTKKRKKM